MHMYVPLFVHNILFFTDKNGRKFTEITLLDKIHLKKYANINHDLNPSK